MSAELFPIPLSDQIAEIRRELSIRDRVYKGLVGRGTMSQKQADRQINTMKAVLETLEGLNGR